MTEPANPQRAIHASLDGLELALRQAHQATGTGARFVDPRSEPGIVVTRGEIDVTHLAEEGIVLTFYAVGDIPVKVLGPMIEPSYLGAHFRWTAGSQVLEGAIQVNVRLELKTTAPAVMNQLNSTEKPLEIVVRLDGIPPAQFPRFTARIRQAAVGVVPEQLDFGRVESVDRTEVQLPPGVPADQTWLRLPALGDLRVACAPARPPSGCTLSLPPGVFDAYPEDEGGRSRGPPIRVVVPGRTLKAGLRRSAAEAGEYELVPTVPWLTVWPRRVTFAGQTESLIPFWVRFEPQSDTPDGDLEGVVQIRPVHPRDGSEEVRVRFDERALDIRVTAHFVRSGWRARVDPLGTSIRVEHGAETGRVQVSLAWLAQGGLRVNELIGVLPDHPEKLTLPIKDHPKSAMSVARAPLPLERILRLGPGPHALRLWLPGEASVNLFETVAVSMAALELLVVQVAPGPVALQPGSRAEVAFVAFRTDGKEPSLRLGSIDLDSEVGPLPVVTIAADREPAMAALAASSVDPLRWGAQWSGWRLVLDARHLESISWESARLRCEVHDEADGLAQAISIPCHCVRPRVTVESALLVARRMRRQGDEVEIQLQARNETSTPIVVPGALGMQPGAQEGELDVHPFQVRLQPGVWTRVVLTGVLPRPPVRPGGYVDTLLERVSVRLKLGSGSRTAPIHVTR